MPARLVAASTRATKLGWAMSWPDTLTCITISANEASRCCHWRSWPQAVRSMKSVSGTINATSSATGMKVDGLIWPSSG